MMEARQNASILMADYTWDMFLFELFLSFLSSSTVVLDSSSSLIIDNRFSRDN